MSTYDAIVIGSGAGGLTAALALARAGQRVIVLEQHYLPGGWCHSFTLEGHRFSPGVHYLGELGEGGMMRAILEGLGLGGDLTFRELNPDGYDHVIVEGAGRFDLPRGRERLRARLEERFPSERAGIQRYLEIIGKLGAELSSLFDFRGLRDVLSLPFRAPTVAWWGLRSAQALIHSSVRDPFLRAILAAQCGDHGLPPSLAPAAIHASVTHHYLDGGWYPQGGGHALPRAFIRGLQAAGGELRLKTAVRRILIENGRACGVALADGTELRARQVISNADPHVTYAKLVGLERLSSGMRRKLRRTTYSTSALSLFLAAEIDPVRAGLDSGNLWWYPSADLEATYAKGLTGWRPDATPDLPGFFLTVTTLKDPGKQRGDLHTMEAFTFVGYDAFRDWAESRCGERPAAYAALKAELKDRMLAAAERLVPGLRERVVFSELGTPLTNEHYVAGTAGNLYGTAKTRFQVGPWAFPVKGSIPGLSLCGSSTVAHGVMGAAVSGLVAARQILRCRTSELLTGGGDPITLLPAYDPRDALRAGPRPAAPAELRA